MMLATGSHDGTVRIYSTSPLEGREGDDESYLERHTEGDREQVSTLFLQVANICLITFYILFLPFSIN